MCALVIVEPMFKLVPKDAPKSAQQKYPKHQKLGFASKKMFGKTFQKILSHMVVEWQFYHGTFRKKITPKKGHNTNFRVPNPQVTVTSSNPTGFFFGGETSTTIKKYYGNSSCWWFPPWKNTPPAQNKFKTLDFCCQRRPKKDETWNALTVFFWFWKKRVFLQGSNSCLHGQDHGQDGRSLNVGGVHIGRDMTFADVSDWKFL